MNLVLTVLSGGQPGRHVFGPAGGRFGRSQKCDWVLPDPNCILSSVHGRIYLDNGTFVLVDESTNGIFIGSNSEPLGKGNSVIAGDRLRFRGGLPDRNTRRGRSGGAGARHARPVLWPAAAGLSAAAAAADLRTPAAAPCPTAGDARSRATREPR